VEKFTDKNERLNDRIRTIDYHVFEGTQHVVCCLTFDNGYSVVGSHRSTSPSTDASERVARCRALVAAEELLRFTEADAPEPESVPSVRPGWIEYIDRSKRDRVRARPMSKQKFAEYTGNSYIGEAGLEGYVVEFQREIDRGHFHPDHRFKILWVPSWRFIRDYEVAPSAATLKEKIVPPMLTFRSRQSDETVLARIMTAEEFKEYTGLTALRDEGEEGHGGYLVEVASSANGINHTDHEGVLCWAPFVWFHKRYYAIEDVS